MVGFGKRKDGQAYPKKTWRSKSRKIGTTNVELTERFRVPKRVWTKKYKKMTVSEEDRLTLSRFKGKAHKHVKKDIVKLNSDLEELGTNRLDVQNKVLVSVVVDDPPSLEIIGIATDAAEEEYMLNNFNYNLEKTPSMTFPEYRKKIRRENDESFHYPTTLDSKESIRQRVAQQNLILKTITSGEVGLEKKYDN